MLNDPQRLSPHTLPATNSSTSRLATNNIILNSKHNSLQIPDLSSMSKVLRTLDLSTNKLTSVPPSVCSLSNLKHLNLNGNKIGKIQEEIDYLWKFDVAMFLFMLNKLPFGLTCILDLSWYFLSLSNDMYV